MNSKVEKGAFQQLFKDFTGKNRYTDVIINRISRCQTAAMGYQCYQCDNEACQHIHTQYHSCGNRHCPFCGTFKKDDWVEARIDDLLPTPYYHMVFTVPHVWNKVMMQDPREFYNVLFDSASETILNHGANPEFLGATPGVTAVLHTWGQKLDYHVHLHCVVSAGGIDKKGDWVEAKRTNNKFLFPESSLKTMYKAIFLKKVEERQHEISCSDAQIEEAIIASGYQKWKVYAKAPFGGPDQVIRYLGRYTHKTAITHHRILSVAGDEIQFSYKDYSDNNKMKVKQLSNQKFMQRFERHILPKRFVRIRHYGFLTNRGKVTRLQAIRAKMGLVPVRAKVEVSVAIKLLEKFGRDITRCDQCQSGHYTLRFTKRGNEITYSDCSRGSPT